MTAFFHHRSLVALMPHRRQLGQDAFAERVDERPLVVADVVEVDARRTRARASSLDPRGVLRRVGGHQHRAAHVLGPHVGRGESNCSTVSRSQHSGGPNTLVRHWSWAIAQRLLVVRAQRQVHLDSTGLPSPPPSRNASSTRSSISRGWLIVISPSAQPPHAARPSPADRGADRAAAARRAGVQSRARSTATSPSWSTSRRASSARITSTHSRSRALRAAFARPALAGDVLVRRLAAAERDPESAGEQLASVATAWATIAGW